VTVENFVGRFPRECGEHRTVGPHRAWCFDCREWCYPLDGCTGCKAAALGVGKFVSWRKLLGEQVTVTLAYDPDGRHPIVVEGQLLQFDENGEVDVRDETGVVHYCWPALEIEPRVNSE
jgi:hypothetical protein